MNEKRNKKAGAEAGFTLIEVLLVVVIIGILAALVVPKLGGRVGQAQEAAARSDIGAIGTAGGAFATAMGTAFSLVGAALVLGGISQAISPSPVQSGNVFERGREAAKMESFSFSGVVNTSKQGLPVPIAYGRLFVGSAVLSSGLDVDQQ